MQGSAFISHAKGWCCSNDVIMQVEQDLMEIEGKRVSKHTNTLRIRGLFGKVSVGEGIECVFKIDDSDRIQGFIGEVTAQTPETTLILLKTKTDRTKEILKKIKEDI